MGIAYRMHQIEKVIEEAIKNGRKEITLAEVSLKTGISPNYARVLLQGIAKEKGFKYKRGVLILKEKQSK